MALYHYIIEDGERLADPVGSEHGELKDARTEAVRIMSEILVMKCDDLFRTETLRVIATDSSGLTLFTIEANLSGAPATRTEPLG